jgi:hypothetical protein
VRDGVPAVTVRGTTDLQLNDKFDFPVLQRCRWLAVLGARSVRA